MSSHSFEFVLNHIITCLRNAECYKSNINEDILNYKGMSGHKTRHFYNNLLTLPNCNYLEIGTYHGSSSISAIYKNKINYALFIDNWSLFHGDKNIFIDAIRKYNSENNSIRVIDNDCWKIDTTTFDKKFNIYLYDGGHDYEDQYKAISHYIGVLDKNCIVLIDDWNWEAVRRGTFDVLRDLNIKIKFKYEIFTEEPHYYVGFDNWWNGIGIFIIDGK